MTEDEIVGWHHQLDGHEFEQSLGVGDRQGRLACYSPWGCKEWNMTEQLNNNKDFQRWGAIGRDRDETKSAMS